MNDEHCGAWLSTDDVAFDRMRRFHQNRVEQIAAGTGPMTVVSDGVLVIHLMSKTSVLTRRRPGHAMLKECGSQICPLGEGKGQTRFNVDGFMHYCGVEGIRAYSLLFRNGVLESVMSDIKYSPDETGTNKLYMLRDITCEQAVFQAVSSFMESVAKLGLELPIIMQSAVIDCKEAFINSGWGFRNSKSHGIDRSPCYLPEIEIESIDGNAETSLRQWCDSLWQACGMEQSLNFDNEGKWRERRR